MDRIPAGHFSKPGSHESVFTSDRLISKSTCAPANFQEGKINISHFLQLAFVIKVSEIEFK